MKVSFEKLVLFWCLLSGALLFFIVFLTTLNIFGFTLHFIARFFGGSFPAIAGYEEIVTVFTGLAVLGMFPYGQLKKGHIAVDFFMEKTHPRFQMIVGCISDTLLCGVAILLSVMMFYGMLEARADGLTTPVVGWQIWYFYLGGFISCLLWFLTTLLPFFSKDEFR